MAEAFADLLLRGVAITPEPHRARQRIHLAGFPGLFQAADNWCWAAVAATVATFYGRSGPGGGAYPQCAIVDRCARMGTTACHPRQPGDLRALCSRLANPPDAVEQGRQDDGRLMLDCVDEESNHQGFLNRALRNLGMYETSIPMWTGRTHDVELHISRPGANGASSCSIETRTIGAELDFDEIGDLIAANRLVCLRTIKNGRRHFILIYGIETYPDADLLVWDPANGADIVEADRLFDEYGPFTHKIVTRPPAPAEGPGPC